MPSNPPYAILSNFAWLPPPPPKKSDINYGFWWDFQFLNYFNLKKYEVKSIDLVKKLV